MKYSYLLILFLIPFLSFSQHPRDTVVSFDDAYKRSYRITRLSGEQLQIDGRLDEPVWTQLGEWSEEFSQVIPFERAHTDSWTRVKIFYDDENIYVGVYCKDSQPEAMNAFIGDRDDNSNGDLVSIAFDTYHDYRVAPEFNINLGGNKTDLTVTDKLSVNLSWNAVWEGRTHINLSDSSWTAEMRIPFSQLRYTQKNEEGIWGLHVRRIIRRNNEVQNWSLIPIKNNGHVFSFGQMQGMHNLPKPRGIEFLPYTMSKFTRTPPQNQNPFQNSGRVQATGGLDAKIALNDFTMDVTINPDYGQVELDPSVMNLTAYETFYEEKRPFFLEGKHILEFDGSAEEMMFYSRRIGAMPSLRPAGMSREGNFASAASYVPILGALKLTGTSRKGVTVGLLESITGRTTARVLRDGQRSREVTEPLTNYTVARVQKNWEGNTLLGGMVTSVNRKLDQPFLRENLVENAFAAGLDFTQYFSNRLYYIDAKGMFSSLHGSGQSILNTKLDATHYYQRLSALDYLSLDSGARSLYGSGGYVKVGRRGNAQWNFSQNLSWSSPGFDLNSVGFNRMSDYKANETEIVFRKTDPWGPFRFAGINLLQKNTWDFGGKAIDNSAGVRWRSLSIKKRIELDLLERYHWNTVDTRRLRGGPDLRYNSNFETQLSFSSDRAKKMMVKLDYSGRHYLNQQSAYNSIHPNVTLRLGNHLRLAGQFDYAWNKDDLQYVTQVEREGLQPVYVMARMNQQTYGVTLNMQLNVTPDFSLQYYGAPFSSFARFSAFKKAENTLSRDYQQRYSVFESQVHDSGMIRVRDQGEEISFADPDFSFNEFRSNFVARWEYRPGSSLYLVWEHQRSNQDAVFYGDWGRNLDRMFSIPATNTFLIKINYWFNL